MKILFFLVVYLYSVQVYAQPAAYTTSNAHSHNDYEQPLPFSDAYRHGFGSIEADIFLVDDSSELLVAHTPAELVTKKRRLDSLYLIPIVNCIKKNHGSPYADHTKRLQILIDVKTTPVATLKKLQETIERYPELTNNPLLQFAISGNRPGPEAFTSYPSYIMFDGEMDKTYPTTALTKIVLMSDDLKKYTLWNGAGNIPEKDLGKLKAEIERCHQLKMPVRFWDAPDNSNAWKTLMQLKVDYINTDKIAALAEFLGR